MRFVLTFVLIAALSLGVMPLAYAQPRLVTPPNATLVADSLIRLRWNPLSDASRYEVAIGWDSLFTLPTVQTLSTTQNTITIRRTSLPYVPVELTAFWRVRARLDSVNVGAWSEVWRFTMPAPKTVPPMVVNQIQEQIRGLYRPSGSTATEDRIELESPAWRPDGLPSSIFFSSNNVVIQNGFFVSQKGMLYSAVTEAPDIMLVRAKQLDSTVVNGTVDPRPTLYYAVYPSSNANLCQSVLCTLIATDKIGWSYPCFFLIRLGTKIVVPTEQPIGLSLDQSQLAGAKLAFGQMSIAQSTIASVPILTSSTATSGWLSLSAVSSVEYSLSSTGSWQPSLRAEWRSGQPKLERLWLRYTPQAIGQNFPLVRYVANDSCDARNQGLLRLEALATQPVPYAYTITSVRDAGASERFLEAVYPNPTRDEATFVLNLSKTSHVKLTMYTMLGSKLQTVADGTFASGQHNLSWQSAGLPSGVYGYRLEVEGVVQSGFVSVVR